MTNSPALLYLLHFSHVSSSSHASSADSPPKTSSAPGPCWEIVSPFPTQTMNSVPSSSYPLQYPAWFLPVEQCRTAVRAAASVHVLRATGEALRGTGRDPWPLQLPGASPHVTSITLGQALLPHFLADASNHRASCSPVGLH